MVQAFKTGAISGSGFPRTNISQKTSIQMITLIARFRLWQ